MRLVVPVLTAAVFAVCAVCILCVAFAASMQTPTALPESVSFPSEKPTLSGGAKVRTRKTQRDQETGRWSLFAGAG